MPVVYPLHICNMEYSPRTDMYRRRSGRRVDIHSLPPELLLSIFEQLDRPSMWSCLLTCSRWRHTSERVIYASPRLSSAVTMKRFISVLEWKEHLRGAVKHLHIRGKADYSSTKSTDWILDVPRCLAPLLPRIRSLTFENVENVSFTRQDTEKTIWGDLERFSRVTELHVKNCRFEFAQDLRHLVFSFPSLTSLTLSHVRWGWQPTVDPSGWQPPRWQRPLPLQTLRLAYLPSVSEYQDAFTWFGNLNTVRELELEQIPTKALWVLSKYLTRLAESGGSLESFTFCPLITPGCGYMENVPYLGHALELQKRLTELDLRIVSLQAMRWVPMVFDAARELPIARVALEFTLDIDNAAKPSRAFIETNERLCQYWRRTLQRVTFVDHPTGNWVPDAHVPYILSSRCPSLVQRGILDVKIGVRYEDF
ncbi:hypothetical protein L226DRAFT_610267 [Lentinus tigrinus ALCF2SS1-7]|uniref:uncharacterized protein n=1 Tax=Lentinus tigrinus ALCF2SS1-7 TaxID=1328758 RepID=UPI001165F2EF|nr:hypothetical protein L226DRAFT_610267 [Lentinus tigrinus ALCF2SS1-7]